jgi:opacity protein-like surface antigen
MRRFFLYAVLLLATASIANAQRFEITPIAGYTFGDSFPIRGGSARISGGLTYGGILSYVAGSHNAFELTYSRQDATGSANSVYLQGPISGPASTNYVFLGGTRLFPISDEAVLFTGLNVGSAFFVATKSKFKTQTTFAFGLNAGVKYFFSDRVGLRLQANLNLPVTDMDASFWWDPNNGTAVGVTSNVPLLQFGFTGGLIVKLYSIINVIN